MASREICVHGQSKKGEPRDIYFRRCFNPKEKEAFCSICGRKPVEGGLDGVHVRADRVITDESQFHFICLDCCKAFGKLAEGKEER